MSLLFLSFADKQLPKNHWTNRIDDGTELSAPSGSEQSDVFVVLIDLHLIKLPGTN